MYVGDLSSRRDFTDVRDIVRAYALLLESEVETGIYNVSSEIPRKVEDILLNLISILVRDNNIQVDPNKFRHSEVPIFIGDSSKINNSVHWKQERDFYASLKETLDWWRAKIRGKTDFPWVF
ncbi:GDP-mannose 4,6-dehydratase [Peribacillus sp. NPDC097224]|uniref:GDP-mannose 4,6-dehydratase n=1 Tax=unclassified Peribacillus TaxID=2675266 RepID=UPI00382CACC7